MDHLRSNHGPFQEQLWTISGAIMDPLRSSYGPFQEQLWTISGALLDYFMTTTLEHFRTTILLYILLLSDIHTCTLFIDLMGT
jgi:hypothetical protein